MCSYFQEFQQFSLSINVIAFFSAQKKRKVSKQDTSELDTTFRAPTHGMRYFGGKFVCTLLLNFSFNQGNVHNFNFLRNGGRLRIILYFVFLLFKRQQRKTTNGCHQVLQSPPSILMGKQLPNLHFQFNHLN